MPSTADTLLERLRELRRRTRALNEHLVEDLRAFAEPDGTFRRLPSGTPGTSVTTTCTALMALASARRLREFYGDDHSQKVRAAFAQVAAAPWTSSKLPEWNAFSTAVVLRASGHLAKTPDLTFLELKNLEHSGVDEVTKTDKKQSFPQIAEDLASNAPQKFGVQGYPPTATIAYWFVDAVDRAAIEIDDSSWRKIAEWASADFPTQLSYLAADNDALKDAVSMAMSACLCKRLHQIALAQSLLPTVGGILPSAVELHHSILEVFKCQNPSGIWPKYFPLFHFRDAGANYCLTFEFLEAVLSEFGDLKLILEDIVLSGLEKAVKWCEQNRLKYHVDDTDFHGWNSGGHIENLRRGVPECWVTATVYMFLCSLDNSLSVAIEDSLMSRYASPRSPEGKKDDSKWKELIDVRVELKTGGIGSVKEIIEQDIITPLLSRPRRSIRQIPITTARSALLFGPPGTAKTSIARATAGRLGWPCLEVLPSHFLNKGLEQIYVRANEIFADLMDLSEVVVLFDEMDALVQRRPVDQSLDPTLQFLTTSMLPKLAQLHDRARLVFFMATNHRISFDPAITRPGRFDLLLCVGPLAWSSILDSLHLVCRRFADKVDCDLAARVLRGWIADDDPLRGLLDRFTFGEIQQLLRGIKGSTSLLEAVNSLGPDEFRKKVQRWGEAIILRDYKTKEPNPLSDYEEYKIDCHESRRQG